MVNLDIIYADSDMEDISPLVNPDVDFEVGTKSDSTNDFEVEFNLTSWNGEILEDGYIYADGTEYGGQIKEVETSTTNDTVYIRGYTWRGILEHKIICPADGQDYYVVNGELNTVIQQILNDFCSGDVFSASEEDTGVTVSNYQFDRYCTVAQGLVKMLKSVDYRLDIKCLSGSAYRLIDYDNIPIMDSDRTSLLTGDRGGGVTLSALPVTDHEEISQDTGDMDFDVELYHRGVNHLICLGQGELAERDVIHLYVEGDGSIGTTQYYFGHDEVEAVYDYSSAMSLDELETYGRERLASLMNYEQYTSTISDHDEDDYKLGDTVTGTDTITGITITEVVTDKIVRRKDGIVSIEHTLGGRD